MCTVLLVALVAASPSDPRVHAGVAAYEELRYRDALTDLEAALAEPNLTHEDRVTALATTARIYAIILRSDDARAAFVRVLEEEPAYLVSYDEPPAVTQSFQQARNDFEREHPGLIAERAAPPPRRIWPWVVGGAAVAATAVILTIVFTGGNGADRPGNLTDTWVLP